MTLLRAGGGDMRSKMGVGRGAANSQEVRGSLARKGVLPATPCTASGEGGILRPGITLRPQVLAKEVSQVVSQTPRPAPWTPKLLQKPRVQCASRTVARSSARGKSRARPALREPAPGPATLTTPSPQPQVPSRAPHCAVPGATPQLPVWVPSGSGHRRDP